MTLTVAENEAIKLLRRSIRRKPEIISLLIEGQAEEVAIEALQKVAVETRQLNFVLEQFVNASTALARKEKPS